MNYFEFDPKVFIRPPYWNCPKCSAEKSFGVLMICDQHYVRRCKECWYDSSYQLPRLNKKVIYVDQFAISNMMKILNPKTKANQKGKVDDYWRLLFSKLDRLCKLQLLICPDSTYHSEESLLSPFYQPLKRMYELLSHGVSFEDGSSIKKRQIYEHAKMWAGGNNEELKPNIRNIVHGRINEWQERYILTVQSTVEQQWVDNLRDVREQSHQGLSTLFQRWQQETGKTFKYWFTEEIMSIGPSILNQYVQFCSKQQKVLMGQLEPTLGNLYPTFGVEVVKTVIDAFERAGLTEDIDTKVVEYLNSPDLVSIPFFKISAMLYAALARKAASGQLRPPNQGTFYDFNIISVLLPYCDAMFIDNACHTYLTEVPLRDEIKYGTTLFSLNNKDEFLDYLDEIEKNASEEHVSKVAEVYGEEWGLPYTSVYKED